MISFLLHSFFGCGEHVGYHYTAPSFKYRSEFLAAFGSIVLVPRHCLYCGEICGYETIVINSFTAHWFYNDVPALPKISKL